MLNKPTWKDSRHFESILESLCSLRIFYIHLPHATQATSLPYNRRHLRSSFSPPRARTVFFFPSYLTLGLEGLVLLLFLIFLLHLAQGRLHPRRWKLFTRHSEHAPPSRPRSRPSPPAFRSGLPFCHANTVPPPPRPRPRPHRACSSHWARKGGQHTNPASSFAPTRDGEISDFAMGSTFARALPTTTGKHRPISQRFS